MTSSKILLITVDMLRRRSAQICVAVSSRSSRGARSWSKRSASGTPKRSSIRPHVLVKTDAAYAMFKVNFSVFWQVYRDIDSDSSTLTHDFPPDLSLTTAVTTLLDYYFFFLNIFFLRCGAQWNSCMSNPYLQAFLSFLCLHTTLEIVPMLKAADGLFVWFYSPSPAPMLWSVSRSFLWSIRLRLTCSLDALS